MISERTYNGNIEVLRYLFTFIVALMHFWNGIFDDTFFLEGGYLAVDFFFILSGFFMAVSLMGKNISPFKFTLNKYLSIFWIYAMSIILSCVILLKNGFSQFLLGTIKAIPDLLCLQMSGFFYPSVNGIVWYISAMLISGFFISAFFYLSKDYSLSLIFPAIIIIGYATVYCKVGNLDATIISKTLIFPLGLLRAFSGMSLGVILQVFFNKLNTKYLIHDVQPKKRIFSIVQFFSISCFSFLMIWHPHSVYDFLSVLLFSVIMIIAFLQNTYWGISVDRIGNGLIKLFGKSYTLALYCFSHITFSVMNFFYDLKQTNIVLATVMYIITWMIVSLIITKLAFYLDNKFNLKNISIKLYDSAV